LLRDARARSQESLAVAIQLEVELERELVGRVGIHRSGARPAASLGQLVEAREGVGEVGFAVDLAAAEQIGDVDADDMGRSVASEPSSFVAVVGGAVVTVVVASRRPRANFDPGAPATCDGALLAARSYARGASGP
jgi:hypothetical protein